MSTVQNEHLPIAEHSSLGQYTDCKHVALCGLHGMHHLYSATDGATGTEVSLLVFPTLTGGTMPPGTRSALLHLVQHDINVLGSLSHPGLLHPIGPAITGDGFLAVAVDPVHLPLSAVLSGLGDMALLDLEAPAHEPHSAVDGDIGQLLTRNMVTRGLAGVISAAAYVAGQSIAHLNISPEAIFIANDGSWVLGGFYFSKRVNTDRDFDQFPLPPRYWSSVPALRPSPMQVAPEMMCGTVTTTTDTFMVGHLLLRLLGLAPPPDIDWTAQGAEKAAIGAHRLAMHALDPRGFQDAYPDPRHADFGGVLFGMVSFDPSLRPRPQDLPGDVLPVSSASLVQYLGVTDVACLHTARQIFFLRHEVPAAAETLSGTQIPAILHALVTLQQSADPVVSPFIVSAFAALAARATNVTPAPASLLAPMAASLNTMATTAATMVELAVGRGASLSSAQRALVEALLSAFEAVVPQLTDDGLDAFFRMTAAGSTLSGGVGWVAAPTLLALLDSDHPTLVAAGRRGAGGIKALLERSPPGRRLPLMVVLLEVGSSVVREFVINLVQATLCALMTDGISDLIGDSGDIDRTLDAVLTIAADAPALPGLPAKLVEWGAGCGVKEDVASAVCGAVESALVSGEPPSVDLPPPLRIRKPYQMSGDDVESIVNGLGDTQISVDIPL